MVLVRDMNCQRAVSLVGDYLEGGLPWRDRRRLERHLAVCPACDAYLEQMRATIVLTGMVTPDDLSDEALAALMVVYDNFLLERNDRERP